MCTNRCLLGRRYIVRSCTCDDICSLRRSNTVPFVGVPLARTIAVPPPTTVFCTLLRAPPGPQVCSSPARSRRQPGSRQSPLSQTKQDRYAESPSSVCPHWGRGSGPIGAHRLVLSSHQTRRVIRPWPNDRGPAAGARNHSLSPRWAVRPRWAIQGTPARRPALPRWCCSPLTCSYEANSGWDHLGPQGSPCTAKESGKFFWATQASVPDPHLPPRLKNRLLLPEEIARPIRAALILCPNKSLVSTVTLVCAPTRLHHPGLRASLCCSVAHPPFPLFPFSSLGNPASASASARSSTHRQGPPIALCVPPSWPRPLINGG
ncbi:hypothetical protein NDU88_002659 [Pleurodeles waltl]|uniref:Uncharacterized protein n=1 Tax=Pleurodeles waltl TaxID=8319 RepID=A0AAV7UDQ8_PLEWA|nr:hypothetical protein NDU88_002659 [Pleurodeles waltl]